MWIFWYFWKILDMRQSRTARHFPLKQLLLDGSHYIRSDVNWVYLETIPAGICLLLTTGIPIVWTLRSKIWRPWNLKYNTVWIWYSLKYSLNTSAVQLVLVYFTEYSSTSCSSTKLSEKATVFRVIPVDCTWTLSSISAWNTRDKKSKFNQEWAVI